MFGDKHIVIIGGGVAGCATALAIKNIYSDIRITIIEKKPSPKEENTKNRIGETLTPHIVVLLEKLGLWQGFLQCKFSPSFGTNAAWGNTSPHVNESINSPYGNGWHIDRTQFDNWLIACAQQQGINFLYHHELLSHQLLEDELTDQSVTNKISIKKHYKNKSSTIPTKKWKLILRNISHIKENTIHKNDIKIKIKKDIQIEANFIIDASGRQALFARSQGAKRINDDHLIGVYQFYNIAPHHSNQFESGTLVESDANGWWYSAKLPNNTLVIARMTDADINKRYQYHKKIHWNTHIQYVQHTYARLKKTTEFMHNSVTSETHIIAAHSQQLDLCAGEGWLATGDAASTYDPLSSLGIFKAFRNAIFASYALVDYMHGRDTEFVKYQGIIRKDYQHYLKKRTEYYAEEERYTSVFWQRRCG